MSAIIKTVRKELTPQLLRDSIVYASGLTVGIWTGNQLNTLHYWFTGTPISYGKRIILLAVCGGIGVGGALWCTDSIEDKETFFKYAAVGVATPLLTLFASCKSVCPCEYQSNICPIDEHDT